MRRSRSLVLFVISGVVLYLAFRTKTPSLKPGHEELDKLCSTVANDCFIVRQYVYKDLKTIQRYVQPDKYSVNGTMMISSLRMKVDSYGHLVPVREEINFHYIVAMIVAPYMTESLSLSKPGKVLSIGLGAGTLDMFYYTKQPQLDITVVDLDPTMVELAGKWFGTVENDRRRTVVADGVKFVEQTVRDGTTYDVIALDACNSADKEFICPAKPFYDVPAMQNMFHALSDTGMLVMNGLALNLTKLKTTVKQHFPSCFVIGTPTINEVWACVKHDRQPMTMEDLFKLSAGNLGLAIDINNYEFSVL